MHINTSKARRIFIVVSCHALDWYDPLTRPAPVDESTGAGHPLPQGERGETIRAPLCPRASKGGKGGNKSIPTPFAPLGERG